jgi:hypothetical protein
VRAWEDELPPGSIVVDDARMQAADAPPAGITVYERWARVVDAGVEFFERQDGSRERVWKEDLPAGAIIVSGARAP